MAFQPEPIFGDIQVIGTLGSLTDNVVLEMNGVSGGKAVVSGTWVGTIKFEQSIDGLRWDPAGSFDGTNGAIVSQTGITTNTIIVLVGIAGIFRLRARFTLYTSGTATVVLRGSNGVSNVFADNLIPGNFRVMSYTNDGAGTAITSQVNGTQRALDVGIDVAGIQVDPRAIRALTSSDVVVANQGVANATPWNENIAQVGGTSITVGQKVMASSIPVTIASDQSTVITTLGNVTGKAIVLKTSTLTTVATTADQVVLTYTVTAGKTFYLQYFDLHAHITALPGNNNPVLMGTASLETPSGTKIYTKDFIHSIYDAPGHNFAEPLPIAAGTVIRVVCTPAATSSTLWRANFGGYEK
jgi:hypothetical protein